MKRREKRRRYRNPVAKELYEQGPKEKSFKDKRDRVKHKKQLLELDDDD